MMKWFRKHNKKLLAIFASALMIVFVGGQALTEAFSPKPQNQVVAYVFGEKIRVRDVAMAKAQGDILRSLQIRLPSALQPLELICLMREARQMGVVVGDQELLAWRNNQPDMNARMMAIRDSRNISIDAIQQTIGDYMRILTAAQLAANAVKVSEPEVRHFVRDLRETVKVALVPLTAADFSQDDEPLTEAELQAHFEAYKLLEPGEDKDGLGFGYRWKPRVMLEYVSANVAQVEASLPTPVVERAKRRAMSYYQSHQDEFMVTEPPATTQPGEAASTQPVMRLKGFSEVQQELEQRMLTEEAARRTAGAMSELIDRLQEPWHTVRIDKDGYKPTPKEVTTAAYLKDIAAEVGQTTGVELAYTAPLPVTQREATSLAGIGESRGVDNDNSPLAFSNFAFRVKGMPDAPGGKDSSRLRLSLYETPRQPLRDMSNNLYLFRVVATIEPTVPESLDEVRTKVESDLRELKAYERAAQAAQALAAAAGEASLGAAVDAADDLKAQLGDTFKLYEPEPFARKQMSSFYGRTVFYPPYIQGVGSSKTLIDACFALGEEAANDPTKTIKVVALPESRKQVIVQWIETKAVTKQAFEEQRKDAITAMESIARSQFAANWFSPDAVAKRVGLKMATDEEQ